MIDPYRYNEVLNATTSALETSLHNHMPAGPYRDFYLWAISGENSHRESWLEVTGIRQVAQLTVALLDGLIDDHQWDGVKQYYPFLNTYFVYENMSDNLAIGLVDSQITHARARQRRDLIYNFNGAMIERLNTSAEAAFALLAPLQPLAQHLSGFDQSLNRAKHLLSAEAFLATRRDVSLEDIEFAVWPALVANMEACAYLADSINGSIGPLLRIGLNNRYWAVNRQMETKKMILPELVDVGAWSILVAPTLAYYTAMLVAAIPLERQLSEITDDHTLAEALYDSASLVRLLNDLGPLVKLTIRDQKLLIDWLMACYKANPRRSPTLSDLLLNAARENKLFPRLFKDIEHGEFNMSLYGVATMESVPSALLAFGGNLAYLSQVYARRYTHLVETLELISSRLGDNRVSTLLLRFVRFHEMLYSNAHTSLAGEFAA